MNGGLIVGSRDGANLELEKELGQQNVFMFGSDKSRLFAYQRFVRSIPITSQLKEKPPGVSHINVTLKSVFDFCRHLPEMRYVTEHFIVPMESGHDPHGVCLDFLSYTQAMDEAQSVYFNSAAKYQEFFSSKTSLKVPGNQLLPKQQSNLSS